MTWIVQIYSVRGLKNTKIRNIYCMDLVAFRMLKISLFLFLQVANVYSAFPFPEECGVNYIAPDNAEDATRIVGGYEAVPGSWPWQAYLKWRGGNIVGWELKLQIKFLN